MIFGRHDDGETGVMVLIWVPKSRKVESSKLLYEVEVPESVALKMRFEKMRIQEV